MPGVEEEEDEAAAMLQICCRMSAGSWGNCWKVAIFGGVLRLLMRDLDLGIMKAGFEF